MSELQEAYKLVIADLEQDIGYEGDAQEKALSVLKGRLHELVHVWSIPNEKWIDPTDDDDLSRLSKLVNELMAEDLNRCETNVVDEIKERMFKFDNPEKDGETNDQKKPVWLHKRTLCYSTIHMPNIQSP